MACLARVVVIGLPRYVTQRGNAAEPSSRMPIARRGVDAIKARDSNPGIGTKRVG